MVGESPILGLLAPEADRTLVVLAADGELAVALRDRSDRGLVVVKDARPEEAEAVIRSCRPWPWMLVGAVPEAGPAVVAALRRPVLALWYGCRPPELPRHARAFARFADLAAAVQRALGGEHAGMRLGTGAGVELPGGRHIAGAALQALVSAGDTGFDLPLGTFRAAARSLAACGVAARPRRDPRTGMVRLGPPG
jgi:hypothetical protein